MGLLGGLFGKKKQTNSVGEDLDHLTPEGELPFGWMAHNQEIVKKMDDEWFFFRSAVDHASDPIKKYGAMKSYLLYLEDGKKHYTDMNECVGKYFEQYYCDNPFTEKVRDQFAKLEKELTTK